MKTNILINGITSFENRGCQALFLSILNLLKKNTTDQDFKFYVLSESPEKDKQLLPDYIDKSQVEFIKFKMSFVNKVIIHIQSKFPTLPYIPVLLPNELKSKLRKTNLVISSGGDVYSLDYLRPVFWHTIDSYAMKQNIKTILLGATLGPFEKDANYKNIFFKHLKNFELVTVRENESIKYLRENNHHNATVQPDVAFALPIETKRVKSLKLDPSEKYLGINLSPYTLSEKGQVFNTIYNFIIENSYIPILIPHVYSCEKPDRDLEILIEFQNYLQLQGCEAKLIRECLNASELKGLIGELNLLIAGRTHCTVAGFSQAIPTISIAYSMKAYGINKAIYGHDGFVINHKEINIDRLNSAYKLLSDKQNKKAETYTTNAKKELNTIFKSLYNV